MLNEIRKVKKYLNFFLPLVLVIFILSRIFKDFSTVKSYFLHIQALPLLASLILLLIVPFLTAIGWQIIICGLGYKKSLKVAIKIWIISSAGRYIPGVIWQYLGRVELAHQRLEIPRQVTVISLILESYMALTSAIFLSLFTIPLLNDHLLISHFLKFKYVFILLLLPLLLFHPYIANKMFRVLAKVFKTNLKSNNLTKSFYLSLKSLPFYLVNFIFHGLALYLLIYSLTNQFSYYQLLEVLSFYSFSWVLGYLVIFAPAGLGVTEGVLAYLLSIILPFSVSGALAVFYRFIMTITEIVSFLMVWRW